LFSKNEAFLEKDVKKTLKERVYLLLLEQKYTTMERQIKNTQPFSH